jgi:hypothetical protein
MKKNPLGNQNFDCKEFCGVAENEMMTKINIMEAYDKLGHIGMQSMKSTSLECSWELSREQRICQTFYLRKTLKERNHC